MIEIEKQVEKRIQYPVHFYQMTLQIEDKDLKYLISKIDEKKLDLYEDYPFLYKKHYLKSFFLSWASNMFRTI